MYQKSWSYALLFLRYGMTNVIVIFHFGLFFALIPPYQPKKWKFHKNGKKPWRYHLTQVCQKSWSYAVLFLRHGEWQMWLLFFILDYFLPFYPFFKSLKNQNLKKKWKKRPEDIIILQKSTINDNHKIYGSWDMKCNRHFFFFGILCHFLPFYPHNSPKNENIKKNPGHIILHRCTKSHDHRLYCSWDKLHDRYNCHFSFCAIFCPFTRITAQKMKI